MLAELARQESPGTGPADGNRVIRARLFSGVLVTRNESGAAMSGCILQTAAVEADCIFCRIVAGAVPEFVVAQDSHTVAFLDRGPANEGHTLVVPRAHSADIWSISESDACAVMAMGRRVAHLLKERLKPDGLNLFQSNRPAGWQDVFHFHLHVVPRWTEDSLVSPWRSTRPSDNELAAVHERLR